MHFRYGIEHELAILRGGDVPAFADFTDLRFAERSRYTGDGFVVQEWTATATHPDGPAVSWDGVDIFPFAGDKILRKDVYSNASRRVPEQLAEQRSA